MTVADWLYLATMAAGYTVGGIGLLINSRAKSRSCPCLLCQGWR